MSNTDINTQTNTDYNQSNLLSIQDCARLYNVSTVTIRKWIKKNHLKASIVNNQYLISKEEIEKLLEEKGLLRTNPEINTQTNTQINPEINPEINPIEGQTSTKTNLTTDQINTINDLKKENEFLREKIATLEHTISILEQDKQFLQAQVQQLTNTISLLTTRQLPEPKGFIDRIKGWFKKE